MSLTGTLGNAPQKIHPTDFPRFDKEMPLSSALKTTVLLNSLN